MSSKSVKLHAWSGLEVTDISFSSPFYSSKQLNIIYFTQLFIGIALVISAINFNTLQCDYPCYPTNHQFAAICAYIFLYPLGFIFIMDTIPKIISSKSIHIMAKLATLSLLGFSCIIIPIYLFLPSHWNGSQYFKLYDKPSNNNYLNKYQLSFTLFILWPPFGILFICMIWRLLQDEKRKEQNKRRTPSKQLKQNLIESLSPEDIEQSRFSSNMSSSTLSSSLIQPVIADPSLIIPFKPFRFYPSLCIFISIIIPLMWLSTTLLPSGYFHFELPIDNKYKQTHSKWTMNIKINNTYLHIYIYTLIYYLVLLLLFGVGFICQQYKKSRKLLRRYIFVYLLRFCGKELLLKLKIGQFILLLIAIPTLTIIWLYFNSYPTTSEITQKLDPFNAEKAFRACGILSSIFFGLSLIPVARGNKILQYCFGVTFDSGIKYHRVLGLGMFIFAIIHFIGFIILLIKNDYYKDIHIFSPKMPFNQDGVYMGQNWTISLMQIVVLFILFPFIITTIKRWRFWEIFYFFHIYGSLVLILALMYHTENAWYFMLPGMIIQFYDRFWRLWNSSNCNSINILSLKQCSTDVAKLRININNHHSTTPLNGWYSISIPHISPFQWHPFSISNPLNSSFTEFYIKNIGNFSSSLLNLSSLTNVNGQRLSLNKMDILIQGPFGADIDYHSYHRVVLVAGGIGITPLHNLFFTLYDQALSNTQNLHNNDEMSMHQLPSIDLIWIARYADIFEIYKQSFKKYMKSDIANYNISLYATREEVRYPSTCNGIEIENNNDEYDPDDIVIEEPLELEQDEEDDNYKSSIHISNSSIASNASLNFPLHSSMNNIIDKKKKKKKSRNKKKKHKKKKSSIGSMLSRKRDVDCPIKWKIGRPDLYQELRYLDQLKHKAIIYCCGPSNLVQTCQELAFLYGNDFKKESFIW